MDALPIDLSHPAIQDYLALVRLQVLTPLSLLINIAALVVCTILTTPTIAEVARLRRADIALPPGDDALHREALERQRDGRVREVDEEAVWGGE
ncbi:hypothetical protein H0H87_006921 [Tephrocybe sp. NHM501043]|nr:hypothetical protein H0H87_006921 [Tephrocybe sp. NHM501043]